VKFRNVQIEDLDSLNKVIDQVSRERQYLATTIGFPLDDHQKFLMYILENNIPQIVAIERNVIVGWCDIIPRQHEGFSHVGYLGMGVLKKFRGNGIGGQLLSACLEQARCYGFEKVEIEVFSDNLPAISMYQKSGFTKEGLRVKSRKLDGGYQNVLLLGLQLTNYNA